MDYIIRKLEEKDLPTLVVLCQHHADYEQAPYDPKNKVALLKNAILNSTPSLFCYVIACESGLAGYFSYTFDFSTWDAQTFLYLDCLYLEPDFRGLKIGEAVFNKLKQIGIDNNCVNIQWQTPIFNVRAIKFYHKIGAVGKDKKRFAYDL
ncbi:GNAT family N-acetyltransferase [Rhizosphaericola mali]|uniref:GNAT family N-acetyltransferase n=1 Tax=Rhizosphaericola mali TaxID=2545455 RepID=A0A5P2G3U1_9BACT|nr:GNAT family N-acetyltransferase [Rhizosphaericola mali]QES89877.1 GNAT family N-acetyltransferase [Rhizosphaericola mali]